MATQFPPPSYTSADDSVLDLQFAQSEGIAGRVKGDFATKVRLFFVVMSLYGMLMLVMIPCWNCCILLQSWTYTTFLGEKAALTFIILLLLAVTFFFGMLMIFFRSTRPEVQTFQTMVMMGSAILTMLGVMFILFGHEVAELSRKAQKEVEHNCPFAATTEPLFVESKVLYALRFRKDCAEQTSVEDCVGFVPTGAARVLKSLEVDFKCSTFCEDVQPPNPDYPRTLFSRGNYRPACQTVLMRNLKFYVEDMGVQAYCQGCMLVLTSAAIGLLKVVGFCAPRHGLFRPKALAGDVPTYRSVDSQGVLS